MDDRHMMYVLIFLMVILAFAGMFYAGYMGIENLEVDEYVVQGFCIGKQGVYNISDYGYKLQVGSEPVNCSSETPVTIAAFVNNAVYEKLKTVESEEKK